MQIDWNSNMESRCPLMFPVTIQINSHLRLGNLNYRMTNDGKNIGCCQLGVERGCQTLQPHRQPCSKAFSKNKISGTLIFTNSGNAFSSKGMGGK